MRLNLLLLVILPGLFFAGCATSDATSKRLGILETRLGILADKVDALEQKQSALEVAHESTGYSKEKVEEGSRDSLIDIERSPKKIHKPEKAVLTAKDIQVALKKAGFYNGPIDGKIGKDTKSAINKFQETNGLKVDGLVGQNTRNLLMQYLEK